jgi:hypothetical protein
MLPSNASRFEEADSTMRDVESGAVALETAAASFRSVSRMPQFDSGAELLREMRELRRENQEQARAIDQKWTEQFRLNDQKMTEQFRLLNVNLGRINERLDKFENQLQYSAANTAAVVANSKLETENDELEPLVHVNTGEDIPGFPRTPRALMELTGTPFLHLSTIVLLILYR